MPAEKQIQEEKKIFVLGHKNPDTDSICSAIAYAWLKNCQSAQSEAAYEAASEKETHEHASEKAAASVRYIPLRAGHINQETAFVLERFGVREPDYIANVEPQVKDIQIRRIEGITENASLRKAYLRMREEELVTLPVVGEDDRLKGVITIGDIAESGMDVCDNRIVGNARTPILNIVETVDGSLLCGNAHAKVTHGRVVIAAASLDFMADFLKPDDLVITSSRQKAQQCAIDCGASCLIVCGPKEIAPQIIETAEKKEVLLIKTPHDTYTTARLINQSMPVQRFMSAKNLISFRLEDTVESVREVLAKCRIRDFPILDHKGNYVGMISRRNLLGLQRKQLILVDHNELSQSVDGASEAEILEIIDHHRLGAPETAYPVYFRCQPLGCTATIIYQLCTEQCIELPPQIAGLLCSAIISDTLLFRSPTCTPYDRKAACALSGLAGIADLEAYAGEMFAAGSRLLEKSAEDLFFQDFKKFSAGEASFGAGQVTSMNEQDFPALIEKLRPFMESELTKLGVDALYFLLTGILSESSYLICCGSHAAETAEAAFRTSAGANGVLYLSGVVSRKKQFVPPMILQLQQK